MKKIAFILGLLMMQLVSIAQEHVFNVVALSGNTKLNNGTGLKSGDQILSNQTIIVGTGGYVALMHKTGKTIELQTAGTYTVTDLSTKVNAGNNSYASQYSDFVINQMTADGTSNNYSNTGSVTRDIMKNIEILLPKEVSVLKNTPFHVSWVSPREKDTYTIKLLDLFDKVVYEQKLSKNETILNFSEISNLVTDSKTPYLLQVCSNEKRGLVSKKIRVIMTETNKEKEITNEFTKLKSELGENTAINSLILASFYEAKGLTVYAAENLENASNQAPKVDHYRKIYLNYLTKKKINTAYLALNDAK